MEVAIIDWKNIDSSFVKDDLYENMNAPKWVDLNSPQDSTDDEVWFCRPDCNHPKRVEDFYKEMPSLKLKRSATVSEILPLGDPNRREATLKKKGFIQASFSSNKDSKFDTIVEDSENQNPNFSTPHNHKANKFMKEADKSSTEKKFVHNALHEKEVPRLKSTQSARNLFAGKDILNQITDFYNELKKLATRAKDRENVEKENIKSSVKTQEEVKDRAGENLRNRNEKEERKPLLAMSQERIEIMAKSRVMEKQRKTRTDESENTPISLDLKNVKGKGYASLSQIRTVPPSPQCFSANGDPTKATPPKAFRSRPQVRGGILQELGKSKEAREEVGGNTDNNHRKIVSGVGEREARTLDVFWFLKPCTLSS